MTTFSIVFVCAGNTCRSPMAADLARRVLPEGLLIHSAGLAAMEGAEASSHARFVARDRGGDLEGHRSRPLTALEVEQADLVLTMTRAQRDLLRLRHPDRAERILSLADCGRGGGEDVSDPFGGGLEEYEATYERIEALLRDALPFVRERMAVGEGS